jgi:hypothetical protein
MARKVMHQVTEQEFHRHCGVIGCLLVRRADARAGQKTMRLTIEEVDALIYHEAMNEAYWATRENPSHAVA